MENQRSPQRAKYKVFMTPELFYGMGKHPFAGTMLSDSHTLWLSSPEGSEPRYNLVKKLAIKVTFSLQLLTVHQRSSG